MRVGILYPMPTWHSTYSLSSVVRHHCETLVRSGIELTLLCAESNPRPEWLAPEISYHPLIPRTFQLRPHEFPDGTGPSPASLIGPLGEHCTGLDLVMTHDFVRLRHYRELRLAAKAVAEANPSLSWLHFMHYDPRILEKYPPDDSSWDGPRVTYACLVPSQVTRAAKALQVPEERVHVIPNRRALSELLSLSPKIEQAVDLDKVAQSDVTILHPWAIHRSQLKQPQHMLFLASILRSMGRSVHLIFADPRVKERESYMASKLKLRWLANALELAEDDLEFLSDNEATRHGVSAAEMSELYRLANVFVHASFSEGGPLAVSEAMMHNNLCVLNANVSSFQDATGGHAIFHPFTNLNEVARGEPMALLQWFEKNREPYELLAKKLSDQLEFNPIMAGRRHTMRRYVTTRAENELSTLLAQFSRSRVGESGGESASL